MTSKKKKTKTDFVRQDNDATGTVEDEYARTMKYVVVSSSKGKKLKYGERAKAGTSCGQHEEEDPRKGTKNFTTHAPPTVGRSEKQAKPALDGNRSSSGEHQERKSTYGTPVFTSADKSATQFGKFRDKSQGKARKIGYECN